MSEQHIALEIERLEVQAKVYASCHAYFTNLLVSLPCDLSIVFENKQGSVKIIDISEHMQPDQAGYHVRWFADSMVKYYQGKYQEINQVLQSLKTVQD